MVMGGGRERERAMDSARSRYTRCLSEGGEAVGVCGRERSETLRPPRHAPHAKSSLLSPKSACRTLGVATAEPGCPTSGVSVARSLTHSRPQFSMCAHSLTCSEWALRYRWEQASHLTQRARTGTLWINKGRWNLGGAR